MCAGVTQRHSGETNCNHRRCNTPTTHPPTPVVKGSVFPAESCPGQSLRFFVLSTCGSVAGQRRQRCDPAKRGRVNVPHHVGVGMRAFPQHSQHINHNTTTALHVTDLKKGRHRGSSVNQSSISLSLYDRRQPVSQRGQRLPCSRRVSVVAHPG